MANLLKIKRGTRAQLNGAVSSNTLNLGEPYLITDEGRIAIGTGSNTYADFAKTSETGTILDEDLTAIAALTGTGILKRTGTNTWSLDTSTYLTGNQSITLSGDASGSGATAITVTLASVGTAGTYTKVTTDAKGRVTAGTTLSASDIPTLTAAKISDFDTQVRTNRLDQMAAPTAAVGLNSQKITGLADPTVPQDAATKAYVDGVAQGLDAKASVHVATTANITLSGIQTIDGVLLVADDRVLVKNQTTTTQNGIYVAAAGAWSRAADADTWNELISAFTFVEEGTTQADTGWVSTTNAGGTLGVTAVSFVQFSSAGTYLAGNGLTLTGSTFDVGGTSGRITVSADAIDIASTYVGQNTITTLGTISTGTWNATAIGVVYGGLGLTAAVTGLLKGNGSAYSVAVAGTDYLSPDSTVDGGTF
jgi:phage-related tail fiber protein